MADDLRIGVLVAIEVRLYREGLAGLLSREPGFAVLGTASNAADAIAMARALAPGVVLLDCAFGRNLPIFREILLASPHSRVVALGLADSDAELLSYAQAGMAGYVTRDGSREELVASIRSAAGGEFLCTPHVAAMLLQRVAVTAPAEARVAQALTRREREVVELVGLDLSNKAIAQRLHIEVSTVKNHVHNILEKLRLRDRRQLARRAYAAPGGSASPDPDAASRY